MVNCSETYIDHAKVEECGSEYWAKLMINSIKSNFGFNDAEIRCFFAGDTADGQYIQCNLDRHLSSELNLPFKFTSVNKEIMKSSNKGEHRLKLIQICVNEKLVYFEFIFYSDTRFGEYRYRTYNVMINMHKPLYLMYQQLASAHSADACDFQQKVLISKSPNYFFSMKFHT